MNWLFHPCYCSSNCFSIKFFDKTVELWKWADIPAPVCLLMGQVPLLLTFHCWLTTWMPWGGRQAVKSEIGFRYTVGETVGDQDFFTHFFVTFRLHFHIILNLIRLWLIHNYMIHISFTNQQCFIFMIILLFILWEWFQVIFNRCFIIESRFFVPYLKLWAQTRSKKA